MLKFFKSGMKEAAIVSFLDEHIWYDLQRISDESRESIDSCILLMHAIIHEIGQGKKQRNVLY